MRFLGLLLFLDLFLHGNTVVSMSGPVRSLAFETAVARLEIRKNKIFLTLEMIILTFLALAFLVSSAGFGPSSEMIYSPSIKFSHLLTACTNTILHVGHIRVAEPADDLSVLLRTLCCCVVQGLGIVLQSLGIGVDSAGIAVWGLSTGVDVQSLGTFLKSLIVVV